LLLLNNLKYFFKNSKGTVQSFNHPIGGADAYGLQKERDDLRDDIS